jgi:hypothetical protein
MPALDRPSALLYARDALRILERNLGLYRRGEWECYRVVAAELRLLLCDTNRIHDRLVDISLVPRLFPDLALGSQAVIAAAEAPGEPRLVFQPAPAALPLQDWLAQELLAPWGKPVSLRELIRTVCEQDGGAHVDPRALADLRTWKERAGHIVAIGEYIASVLAPLLAEDGHRAA